MNFVTVDEFAKMIRIEPETLRNKLSRGEPLPPSTKIGGRRLFLESDVKEWIVKKIESKY